MPLSALVNPEIISKPVGGFVQVQDADIVAA
jgi:hypothetical protein